MPSSSDPGQPSFSGTPPLLGGGLAMASGFRAGGAGQGRAAARWLQARLQLLSDLRNARQ